MLITYARARQLLNVQAAQVGKAARRPAREINTLLNRAVQRRHREEFTLGDLGQGLDLARQWLVDLSSLPSGPADSVLLPEEEIQAMGGSALREALNACVGRLVAATGTSFPEAQTLLTQTTGAARRAEAGVDELRDTLVLAQRWIRRR
ncbi:hypothetical protein [Streptomyces sp. NPDC006552]|uniref:hypothetical protein n=1 Tax=Streptomyces sp. NPDC006552 TaxID=3157179 RepID=UPI0033A3B1B1